jgi:hypothetical protein
MYKDLADAVESLKEKGFEHTYEIKDDHIVCKELDLVYPPGSLKILKSYTFDKGTDPGSEATLHVIESKKGIKGTLILSYGMYVNRSQAEVINRLLSAQEEA